MSLRRVLAAGLLGVASLAPTARADGPICGVVVFYRQDGDVTVYRGVRYGEIDVVTHEESFNVVSRYPVDPNDLIGLNPDQEFRCVPPPERSPER